MVICIIGLTERKVRNTAGAKEGDIIILTSAGIRYNNSATDREEQLEDVFNQTLIDNAKRFYNHISVVKAP